MPGVGNSEAAVLSRIAARSGELNFDRIGRATAAEADDLKDIVGIGPFLERKLHSLGIFTFRQIANFTREDTAKVNEIIEFFPGRIERDNWVDQSKLYHERKYGQRS
jgi:predicted flap endonuclease-1-like 5' DNA nuclease